MYNDYYLQLIYGEIQNTNEYLETIITNQNEIKLQQQIDYSGDIITRENQGIMTTHIVATNLILILLILYTFIGRCIKA